MDRLQSRVNSSDAAFKSNHGHNSALLETLRERLETVQQGGGGKYVDKHRSRGKALPRERISAICDPGTPFLELSPLAAF